MFEKTLLKYVYYLIILIFIGNGIALILSVLLHKYALFMVGLLQMVAILLVIYTLKRKNI